MRRDVGMVHTEISNLSDNELAGKGGRGRAEALKVSLSFAVRRRATLPPPMSRAPRRLAFLKKPCIYDRHTGAAEPVEHFVMVLGASNYACAEATRTQRLADFA